MNYENLGLKIGLEIHQQLDTHKLFCNCPSLLKENQKPDLIIKRNLYALSGELGKIDVAALYEHEKKRDFYYYYWKDCCCLVELDEMPPKPINQEALKIALQIALLLNAEILPLTQVMRKIVIDGSDVSGFQRTLLLAKNGFIEYEFNGKRKKLKIKTICLEEEAAKKVKQEDNAIYYSLDRYGIPLVEITTDSSIKHPQEAKIAALKIGELLRVCKVKRGIGTIRQDLNVSIKNGVRTEIKGVQEPKLIAKVLENEIKQQLEAIQKGKKLEPSVKKANEDGSLTFLRPLPGSARMYPETDLPLINIPKELIKKIKAELPKTLDQIRKELRELSNKDFIEILTQDRERYTIYKEIIKKLNIKDAELKKFVASILINYVKEISKENNISESEIINKIQKYLIEILNDYNKKIVSKQAIKQILKEIIEGKNYNEIKSKFRLYSPTELEKKVREFIKENKIEQKYWIQEAIKRFKFNAEVKDIIEIVKKFQKRGENEIREG